MSQYTLVRHSGYAVGGNAAFEDAVEYVEVTGDQAYRVRAAGGVLLGSLAEAQTAAEAENYPAGTTQGSPRASGYFSSARIGGAEIYVPRVAPGNA